MRVYLHTYIHEHIYTCTHTHAQKAVRSKCLFSPEVLWKRCLLVWMCEDRMGLEECEEQASKDRKPEPLGIQVRQY